MNAEMHPTVRPRVILFVCPSTGLEFLVPKTGFFCKVCARFFSGSKEAEISHCKTRKHYEMLQVEHAVISLDEKTEFSLLFVSYSLPV